MNILLFGGAGFIGTNIAKFALEKGHTVIACDNLMRQGVGENLAFLRTYKRFSFIWFDVRMISEYAFLPTNVDCIINLAANPAIPRSISDPLTDFDINVRGHINILEFSRTNGRIPVIFASSNKVYTDRLNTFPIREDKTRYEYLDTTLQNGIRENVDVDGYEGYTNSPYGAAKLSAEKYTREYWKHYGIPTVINRMSCIYGEFQKGVEDQGWLDWFLRAKRNNHRLTIYGTGKQVRDVLFGRDVASLYIDEAEHMDKYGGKTFNVGGGNKQGFHTSLIESISLIDSLFPGPKLRIIHKPWRGSDQRIYISDIQRVSEINGWKPKTSLAAGLKKMWKAY